jgi:hypothetical protein
VKRSRLLQAAQVEPGMVIRSICAATNLPEDFVAVK